MAETDVVATGVAAAEAGNGKAATDGNPSGSSDWAKDFDDGLKKKVERFKTPADLAKSYVELETHASKAFQDMTTSEQEKYLKRLGLPEKPEEYELSTIALPDGIEVSKTADDEFKAFALANKFSRGQAKALHEWSRKRFSEATIAARAAAKKQTEDQETALRNAWAGSHDANQKTVDRLIALGGDEFVAYMNSGPGKSAAMRKGLFELSRSFNEETLVAGKVARPKTSTIPAGFVFDPSKSPELTGDRKTG